MGARKHVKVARNKNLEESVYKWYVQQRLSGVNIRWRELRKAANDLAQHMKITFDASDGCMWRFRNRHGMANKKLHGEGGSAATEDVELYHLTLDLQ